MVVPGLPSIALLITTLVFNIGDGVRDALILAAIFTSSLGGTSAETALVYGSSTASRALTALALELKGQL